MVQFTGITECRRTTLNKLYPLNLLAVALFLLSGILPGADLRGDTNGWGDARLAQALGELGYVVDDEEAEPVELLILATTDLHCRLLPDSIRGGGLAKAAAVITELRAGAQSSILLDVGDAFEGSADADYYALVERAGPHPLIGAMNQLGYEAMAVGNHEFTYGLSFLEKVKQKLSFPLLAANLASDDVWWPGHTLIECGTIRVLVVGVTTPWTAEVEVNAVRGKVTFHDQVKRLRDIIPRLREELDPDLVVVLAHTGLGTEGFIPGSENQGYALATEVPGIDVLLLGHTHTTVNQNIKGSLVLQAGARGSHVAAARITLEPTESGWNILSKKGEVLSTDAVEPDPVLQEAFVRAQGPVAQWLNQEIGSLTEPLGAAMSSSRQDALSSVILETMLQYGQGSAAMIPAPAEDFLLPAGPVLRRDLYRLQPYLNHLVTVELTRDAFVQCLEHAAAVWDVYPYDGSYPPPVSPGRERNSFLVAGGIEYILDYTKEPGRRVIALKRFGKPARNSDTFHVVITSYMRTGVQGFTWFKDAPETRRSETWLRSYLEKWFAAHPHYRPGPWRGWFSLPTYQGHWAQLVLDKMLQQAENEVLVALDWTSPLMPMEMEVLAGTLLGQELSSQVADVLASPAILTRGRLAEALVRWIPNAVATPGAAADRFVDIHPATSMSLWDSVVTSGLMAYLPGDSLRPDAPVDTDELISLLVNARYRALTLVSSNDFHGALERNPRRRQAGIGGAMAWITAARKENPAGVVLLDAGDVMQGTPISNLFNGESTISFYNQLGYDAATVGNHDFDWGQEILRDRAAQAHFPLLGANIIERESGRLPSFLQPWVMVERGGVRVAVIGVCTPATPMITLSDNVEGLEFLDPSTSIKQWLAGAKKEKPDIVALSSHLGLEYMKDRWVGEAIRIARAAAEEVDVFFNGHTHQFYATTVDGLPVLQGGSSGRAFSVVRMWVDRLGHQRPLLRARVERLDPTRYRDLEMERLVEEYRQELAPLTEVVIARLASPLSRISNDAGESPMGRVIAEAQRKMVGGAKIALMNPGGVRADLGAGDVTWQDLYTVQPFGNTLIKGTLSGKELVKALENGIRASGSNILVAGIDVYIDRARPFGKRVVKVLLEDGTPLDAHGKYEVVFNNFMGGGGDNYTMLKAAEPRIDTGFADVNALIKYLKKLPQPAEYTLPPRMHLIEYP